MNSEALFVNERKGTNCYLRMYSILLGMLGLQYKGCWKGMS